MRCHRCGTEMEMTVVSEQKKRGILFILLCIVLCILFLPLGIAVIVIALIRGRKIKGTTYAVCPHCGHRKKV